MMIKRIYDCEKCGLCNNQKPLLEGYIRDCQIFWVGLSAKKITDEDDIPLSPNTKSGLLIKSIEDRCDNVITYKTNLVKCLPLNDDEKLRYPNRKEVDACFENLLVEIKTLSPKIVFLLGEKVYSSVERHLNITFEKWENFEYKYIEHDGVYYVPIQHPSYISVYKRRYTEEYIEGIEKVIEDLL